MPSKEYYLSIRQWLVTLGYNQEVKMLDNHYKTVHIYNKEGVHIKTL